MKQSIGPLSPLAEEARVPAGDRRELERLFSSNGHASRSLEPVRRRILDSLQDLAGAMAVTGNRKPEYLLRQFQGPCDIEHQMSFKDYAEYLINTIVPHSVKLSSTTCMAHMMGITPTFVRPIAELITALNQNLVKCEASPVLTLLERQTLATMHRLVFRRPDTFYTEHAQMPGSTLGLMTSGSTTANITALWIARNQALASHGSFAGIEREGMGAALKHFRYRSAVFVGSTLMHYSIDKAAGLLGLGSDGVIKIPVNRNGQLKTEVLHEVIGHCRTSRRKILAIIGTAGTTDAGTIDSLGELAVMAKNAGIHFHVDAAWGGPLLFSQRHKDKLKGIEQADSVTLDSHKQMHLPVGAGMVLLRDPEAAAFIQKEAQYMLHNESGDLGKRSLEGSRPANALFLHAALRIVGRSGYQALIDHHIQMAAAFAEQVRERTDFELLVEPETNIVLYRYLPKSFRSVRRNGNRSLEDLERINVCNILLQKAQFNAGRTFVSRTTLFDAPAYPDVRVVSLRAVITNPFTEDANIANVLNDQVRIGDDLWRVGLKPVCG
jgi:glutamate decarboxylase